MNICRDFCTQKNYNLQVCLKKLQALSHNRLRANMLWTTPKTDFFQKLPNPTLYQLILIPFTSIIFIKSCFAFRCIGSWLLWYKIKILILLKKWEIKTGQKFVWIQNVNFKQFFCRHYSFQEQINLDLTFSTLSSSNLVLLLLLLLLPLVNPIKLKIV